MSKWVLEVPLEMESANKHLVNGGGRAAAIVAGAKYRKARDTWTRALMVLARNAEIPKATAKRRITLTRIIAKGQRQFDYGNLVGGAKHVLDACKLAGLIVDDSPKWCFELYEQRKRFGTHERGTLILIEDIPDGDNLRQDLINWLRYEASRVR